MDLQQVTSAVLQYNKHDSNFVVKNMFFNVMIIITARADLCTMYMYY